LSQGVGLGQGGALSLGKGSPVSEPRNRYSTVSLLFHWGTALLVVTQIVLISLHEGVSGSDPDPFIGLHKSTGLLILVLTLARLGWRFANPAIPLPERTPGWQKIAARATHVGFYLLLIGLPLGGWAASSAARRPIEWYGLFEWPLLPLPQSRDLARDMMDLHETGVKLLYVLLALHILGALKHHFVDRDNVLHRMIPLIPRRP